MDGLDKYCLSKLLSSTANNNMLAEDYISYRSLDSSPDDPGNRLIPLPDGTRRSLLEVSDELAQYHQYDDEIFEGSRAIEVYKRHFGAKADDQAIRFGYKLLGYGVLSIVSASAMGFEAYQLRLFSTLPGRNTLFPWPGRKLTDLGQCLTLLRNIRKTMDKVNQPGDAQRRLRLLRQVDSEICALQACTLHKSSSLFLLQLFNVMVHHYGLNHAFPTTLPEILALHEELGYRVDDRYVTAADLRKWLLQGSSTAKAPRVVGSENRKKKLQLLLCTKASEEETDEFRGPARHAFAKRFITTDRRLIFGMAWTPGMGTQDAPLDQIVAAYCHSNIAIYKNTVFLPPLLRWFRKDFGTDASAILGQLKRHLPIGLRLQIQNLRSEGKLRVTFRNHHVSMSSNPVDVDGEGTVNTDQKSTQLSCYLDGMSMSDNNTMGPMSIIGGMSVIGGASVIGAQSFRHGRGYRMQSMSAIVAKENTNNETIKTQGSSDEGETRSTAEDSSSSEGQNNGDDYASWFQSEMSVMTYGSDVDVLLNEAYFPGVYEDHSQRTISLLR